MRTFPSIIFGCVISAACCVSPAIPALAKPQPPAVLREIHKEFNRLEEALDNRNWKSALDGANIVKRTFLSMMPDIKKYSTSESGSLFVEVMGGFYQDLAARDLAKSLNSFCVVQGVFVKMMDTYEYQVPPPVTFLGINIREAVESFERKLYDEVAREMRELIVLLSQAENDLRNKGLDAGELRNFKILLINTKMASEVSDPVQTQEGLDTIQRKYRAFLALW